jgi:hypothetical protein
MTLQQNKTAAYGIFSREAHLEQVLQSLQLAGFQKENICIFLTPTHPIAEKVQNMAIGPSSDGSAEEGATDVVAWLSQFGAVVIPGVGLFVGSREFLRALTQSDWAIAECDGGMLTGLGIPQPHAARFETRVREDATLVFVSCDGYAQAQWAREILRRMPAEQVSLLGELDQPFRRQREDGTVCSLAS